MDMDMDMDMDVDKDGVDSPNASPIDGRSPVIPPIAEGPVHAQYGAGEPQHGGEEGEGEDGAPDVAPAITPREHPEEPVPRPTALGAQLSRKKN